MKTKIQWEDPPRDPDPLAFLRRMVIALLLCLWAASAFMALAAVLLRHG